VIFIVADDNIYHHGDLQAVLLLSAEAELVEKGMEAFSLRQVAKRAGVSHAAPKHHFSDTRGLLTALAAKGYNRLVAVQIARETIACSDPQSQLLAAGLGYVDFAMQNPALFRLMFHSDRTSHTDPTLSSACSALYQHLQAQVLAVGNKPHHFDAIWAITHGIADLLVSGRMQHLQDMTSSERDIWLLDILSKGESIINQQPTFNSLAGE
jgi:AcrR family transcriptional regulator